MSKPPLILSPGVLLSNLRPLRIQNFRAKRRSSAFLLGKHMALKSLLVSRWHWLLLDGLETNRLVLWGSLISPDPVMRARWQLSYFSVSKMKLGQRSRSACLSARIRGIRICRESVTLAGDSQVFGLFWSMSLRKTLAWVLAWMVSFAK